MSSSSAQLSNSWASARSGASTVLGAQGETSRDSGRFHLGAYRPTEKTQEAALQPSPCNPPSTCQCHHLPEAQFWSPLSPTQKPVAPSSTLSDLAQPPFQAYYLQFCYHAPLFANHTFPLSSVSCPHSGCDLECHLWPFMQSEVALVVLPAPAAPILFITSSCITSSFTLYGPFCLLP